MNDLKHDYRKEVDDDGPELPDDLREILFGTQTAEDQVAPDTPPGYCPIHGNVGFGRFMLIDKGELVSDHCVRCVSRIFVALVGNLEMPNEEPVQCTPEEVKKQGG